MRLGLGPDHEDIGDRRVRDPHLRAVQHIAAGGLLRRGLHARRVRSRIRFGQAKTADPFAATPVSAGIFCVALRCHRHRSDTSPDWIAPTSCCDSRSRPAPPRARPGRRRHSDAPSPPYSSGTVTPSRPISPISRKDAGVGLFLAVGRNHARLQLFLRIGPRAVAQHPLFLGQLVVQPERVFPVKTAQIGGILGFQLGLSVIAGFLCVRGGNQFFSILA